MDKDKIKNKRDSILGECPQWIKTTTYILMSAIICALIMAVINSFYHKDNIYEVRIISHDTDLIIKSDSILKQQKEIFLYRNQIDSLNDIINQQHTEVKTCKHCDFDTVTSRCFILKRYDRAIFILNWNILKPNSKLD